MLRVSFATHWKNYLASLQLSDTRKVERTALQTKRQLLLSSYMVIYYSK